MVSLNLRFGVFWFVLHDSVPVILPIRESQLGNVAQWTAAGVAFCALILAAFSAWWAAKQWRLQYFTKEWASTIRFLFDNPEFLNPEKNERYKDVYEHTDRFKYELIARVSIAYVDDLYHLRTGKYLKSWLRGSVKLFVSPHIQWFRDNTDAYDRKFVEAINRMIIQ